GIVAVVATAVRLICCWANAAALPSSRVVAASADLTKAGLNLRDAIAISNLFVLVRFVDYEFAGIDQHHHQHAAGEDVVRGDLALVVRVPHEGETGFRGWVVGDGAGRRCSSCRAARGGIPSACAGSERRACGCIRAKVWAAAEPRAVGKEIRVRQRD